MQEIQSLKNKILMLAIQGKLVPQMETEEPASVLLQKIQQEKEQLIKEKKIKKGDLIYTSNGATVAWLGKKDVDSDDFKVTESTTDIVLVVLGNLHTDSEYSRCIAREIYEMIKLCSREAEIDFYEII